MGAIRTLGAVTAVKGTPTPAVLAAAYYTSSNLAVPGVVIGTASFSIVKNIATITFTSGYTGANFPANGYNGPNNAIQGVFPPPGGQQVVLWGFGTATYFNGKRVSVISNNPVTGSFSFYFVHANASGSDTTGLTAPIPAERYRAIRLECGQALSTDLIYVGDGNVSSTQYMACLSLVGQLAIELAGDNIPPEGIWIDTSGTSEGDVCQVSVVY